MKVAVVDYGMGNIGSVRRALLMLGADVYVADQPDDLDHADRLVVPGVGSFADGITHLKERRLYTEICKQVIERKKPYLGICLGMQLLAARGTEGGEVAGFGLIDGEVARLDQLGCTERIPHVGWNSIFIEGASPLLNGVPDETDFYFVHSYAFQPREPQSVMAVTKYGITFPAVIGQEYIFGVQFHPEKSSRAGMRILKNFIELDIC